MHAHARRLLVQSLARQTAASRPWVRPNTILRTLATTHQPVPPNAHSDLDEPLAETGRATATTSTTGTKAAASETEAATLSAEEMASRSEESFQTQKRRLLASLDVLVQIQNGPMEKNERSDLDDIEVEYWTQRIQSAIHDLQQERTRLRVAVIGDSSGQESLMDLLMPSEENVRRSAKDTGRVHRLRYGSEYSASSEETGAEILERAPISWLEGLGDEDGGEIVEVAGYDLDDLTMDDIVYNSDLILLRTDALRQLSLEEEQRFLHRYRNKSNIVIVADMNTTISSDPRQPQQQQQQQQAYALAMAALKSNLHRAVKSTSHGYSNIQHYQRYQDSSLLGTHQHHFAGKILRVANPDPLPIILQLTPRHVDEQRHVETVGALQHLVASTLLYEPAQTTHRRAALLTRARDLMTAGIEAVEQRLVERLKTYARVDQLSEQLTEEIKRVSQQERRGRTLAGKEADAQDGDIGNQVDQDAQTMHRVVDHFFQREVPFWRLFDRSGEIAERFEELWAAGAFAETEHRMAYALGRLHQTAQGVFWTTDQALKLLVRQLEDQGRPIGYKAVKQDVDAACAVLDKARDHVRRGVREQGEFVLSNIVWRARATFGGPLSTLRQQAQASKLANDKQASSIPSSSSSSSSTSSSSTTTTATTTRTTTTTTTPSPASVLDRLQRRGQVALAQGLGIEASAVATGVGLATQFPPEVYLTSAGGIALLGLGYMQVRWKAAQTEFRAEADQVAQQLKREILDTYEDQVQRTMVDPLTQVVAMLDKHLGDRLVRSLDQRDVLKSIKKDAQGLDPVKY